MVVMNTKLHCRLESVMCVNPFWAISAADSIELSRVYGVRKKYV